MILTIGLVTVGCAPTSDEEKPEIGATRLEDAIGRARSSADRLGLRLMKALGEQLETGGSAAAITVCSEIAPAMASEISREGIEIRRTSSRYRNPGNAPDDWELAWLSRFEESLAGGELPKDIHEVDDALGELRYLRPIVVVPQCLRCHGAEDELDPEVREQLVQSYPGDRATGFSVGDLRGAFSVRVELRDADLDRPAGPY